MRYDALACAKAQKMTQFLLLSTHVDKVMSAQEDHQRLAYLLDALYAAFVSGQESRKKSR